MTGSKLVLDTSAVIELFKGNPAVASQILAEITVKIPSIVLGELYFGVYRSSNPAKHTLQVNKFVANCEVLTVDVETAEIYATIKTKLLKKGKPIPENDIWIAAIAIQYNLSLVTFDKHFKEVDDLKLEAWK
jgi:tRNA(fMet)-specific endonuclease VapC